MMKILKALQLRPQEGNVGLTRTVSEIIARVRTEGDRALMDYNEKFDHCTRPAFRVSKEEIENAYRQATQQDLEDMRRTQTNLETFAQDGALPQILTKVNPKFRTPYVAILFLGLLTFLLVLTKFHELHCFCQSVCRSVYLYIGDYGGLWIEKKTSGSAASLSGSLYSGRYRHFHCRLYYHDHTAGVIGDYQRNRLVSFGHGPVFCLSVVKKKQGVPEALGMQVVQVELEEPSSEEKAKMDREYKIWRGIVVIAVIASAALYVIPCFVV